MKKILYRKKKTQKPPYVFFLVQKMNFISLNSKIENKTQNVKAHQLIFGEKKC